MKDEFREGGHLYNLGNDRLLQGDVRGAARQFSRALRLHPTDVWALNNRGLTRLRMGKPEKARRDFEAALAIAPAFEPARRNLAQTMRGQHDESSGSRESYTDAP
jgi:Flp pilus assembly protein TadD